MKQYTNEFQTAKLMELGFEKPKMAAPALKWVDGEPTFEPQYTIGELIEMLDKYQDKLSMVKTEHRWFINYHTKNIELIDALYDMIIKLKEEGVI